MMAQTKRIRELISKAERIIAAKDDPLTYAQMLVGETEDRFPSIFLTDGITSRVYSLTRSEFEQLQEKREAAGSSPIVLITLARCREVTAYMKRKANTGDKHERKRIS